MSIMIDTKPGLVFFNLLQCSMALKIQRDTGLTHSRGSVLKYVQRTYGVVSKRIAPAVKELEAMVEAGHAAKKFEIDGGPIVVTREFESDIEWDAFLRGLKLFGIEPDLG